MEEVPTDEECEFFLQKNESLGGPQASLGLSVPEKIATEKDNPGYYEKQKMAMLYLWNADMAATPLAVL